MFISYIMAMIVLRDHTQKNIITIFLTPIVVSMTLIGVVYLVAILTGTGLDTYKFVKAGTKAWFHAGNEIGAILSICLPVILLYGIRSTKNVVHLVYWIPALLVIFSLVMLGTKVGYLAIIISLGLALFALVVSQLLTKQPNLKPSLLIISVLLAGVLLSTPYTPAFSNTETHIRIIDEITGEVEEPMPEAPEVVIDEDAGVLKRYSNRVINILLSSRQIFLKNTHEMFVEAPLIQKLFGMGYAGIYPERPKLVEMDFLDLFYSYGIIGSIVYMLPIFYAFVLLFKNVRHHLEKLLLVEFLLVFSSLFLGFGIAFIAGHVLFAPAVSIYLAVLGSVGTVLLLPGEAP
ncbi:O-antigen ligase family protein [Anaerobacillus sp. CMMVII]|nr:O-antigen ligase family protein [Anaerobacillus sp. CMMVII]